MQLELPVIPNGVNPKRHSTAALQNLSDSPVPSKRRKVLECGSAVPLSILFLVDRNSQSHPNRSGTWPPIYSRGSCSVGGYVVNCAFLMEAKFKNRPVRVGLISLGCAKNLVDSE